MIKCRGSGGWSFYFGRFDTVARRLGDTGLGDAGCWASPGSTGLKKNLPLALVSYCKLSLKAVLQGQH